LLYKTTKAKRDYWKEYYRRPGIAEKYSKRNKNPLRKEYIRNYQKIKYKEIRLQVINHYTNNKHECQCKKCDVNGLGFLTIDHVNNDGKKDRKGRCALQVVTGIIKNNYPKSYQILCFNCNSSKAIFGKCYHYQ